MFDLGVTLYHGIEHPRDRPAALKWWRRCADTGHVRCKLRLADALLDGGSVPEESAALCQDSGLAVTRVHAAPLGGEASGAALASMQAQLAQLRGEMQSMQAALACKDAKQVPQCTQPAWAGVLSFPLQMHPLLGPKLVRRRPKLMLHVPLLYKFPLGNWIVPSGKPAERAHYSWCASYWR